MIDLMIVCHKKYIKDTKWKKYFLIEQKILSNLKNKNNSDYSLIYVWYINIYVMTIDN